MANWNNDEQKRQNFDPPTLRSDMAFFSVNSLTFILHFFDRMPTENAVCGLGFGKVCFRNDVQSAHTLGLSGIFKKCSDQHARARSVVYRPKNPCGTLSKPFYSAN